MSLLDLARERYSERRFSSAPIEDDKLDAILEAGRLAPTARNLQPQRFLVVRSPEGLEKMDRCTRCRFGAPVVLMLAYDLTAQAYNPDVEQFGIIDATISATQMMLEAQELGIHSCWIGLIDPSELRRQFNVPRALRIISVMDLGYPSEQSMPAPLHEKSVPIEQLVAYESYDAQE